MKVLVIGATGMLGYSLFSNLSDYKHLDVFGTVRSIKKKEVFFKNRISKLFTNININDTSSIERIINYLKPDIVLNCIGLIKQHDISKQHISAITVNALFPHQLANICDNNGSKLIHFSTDCVFDGTIGNYKENDLPTATDLYGKSKCLGEVNYGRHITLRTSIIGHELSTSVSLIDWFLSQEKCVDGFSKAIFSGLPTCYIAKILAELIFTNPKLKGMYHLSVDPIDKFSLLTLVAESYKKRITINNNTSFSINRSLNSTNFRNLTGFVPPKWHELVEYMHNDYIKRYIL
ncbi:dTDP-4-dehydrorhamnose reductase family protein [Providencia vermicola]|uniref:dTDP-4-dehydrorhamnose reductase family protein n=1 Tax=Morganellaceae TaxID=1903414 RepID=UPI0007DC2E68|nr:MULTISPECIES: SDR family oxidoreductase [Morganellaceae]MCU9564837.1 SDR family oxidoreductase [Proteus mirabilis]MDM3696003.1 SDR family oxidoreductase [Proteus mirabilis]OAS31815.1 NAD(P)-dependent oxidoreductase [Proteus mirabilis]OAS33283.1 NAD(P)-dependent oxidoreductase [Proteus mirabilis]